MVLKVYGDITESESLKVRVNNDVKELTSSLNCVEFSVEEKGIYEVLIEQKVSKKKYTLKNVLCFILTAILRGIIYILLMDSESDWYKKVNAYCIKAKITVPLYEDTSIHFIYRKSKFDVEKKGYNKPRFEIDESLDYDISYEGNFIDIKNGFYKYAKKFTSVISVVVLLFLYLLFLSTTNGSVWGFVISIIVLFAAFLIWLLVLIREYNRCRDLYVRANKKV